MKKLLIAAALAMGFASMSHAAVYYWGAAAATDLATYAGDTVYVLASSFAWSDSTTAADVINAAVSHGTVDSAGRGKYQVAQQSFSDSAALPASYDALFVLIDGDGKYVKWTDTLTGNSEQETSPTTTALTASGIGGYITAQGGMKSFGGTPGPTPIPEPTSGLLMLLGVAGLALRRRRA